MALGPEHGGKKNNRCPPKESLPEFAQAVNTRCALRIFGDDCQSAQPGKIAYPPKSCGILMLEHKDAASHRQVPERKPGLAIQTTIHDQPTGGDSLAMPHAASYSGSR